MKRLFLILLKKKLLIIYKTFLRPLLDYADLIYDKRFNYSFKEKLANIQYSATLIITGVIKDIPWERLY